MRDDDATDRTWMPYVWAVVMGLPGYLIMSETDGLALDVFGWFLLVVGVAPVVVYELWMLITTPFWLASKAAPSREAKRNRALRKAENERQAARRHVAEAAAARERDAC